MLIGDLDKDTEVTIRVTDGEKAVQFNSPVLELSEADHQACLKEVKKLGYQSFVGIQVIKAGDRFVNFSSDKITCTVTALKNNKPYSWKEVKIERLTLPEKGNIHVVLSNDDVRTFNRRSEYRLFLGQEGICRFGDSKEPKNVVVKDISCSGLGMIIAKSDDLEITVGMQIEVQFLEMGADGNRQKYIVNGRVMRYVSLGNNRELIGCKLLGRNPELEKMIYAKQRQNMTVNHRPQIKKGSNRDLARDLAALCGQQSE